MYKVSYTGDGETTQYIFAFPFFQDADVRVAINESVMDSANYAVVANDDFDGGTVVFPIAPESGAQIDIFRQIALTRVIDYQPTAKIDPENLNSDFNFLVEAFRDLHEIDIDLTEWKNTHNNVMAFLEYNLSVIQDKLTGGAVMGLYGNLVSVLENALPKLINDYGSITEPAPNENRDDYGVL